MVKVPSHATVSLEEGSKVDGVEGPIEKRPPGSNCNVEFRQERLKKSFQKSRIRSLKCYLLPTRAPSCSRRSAISTYPRLAARWSAVSPLLSYRRVICDLGNRNISTILWRAASLRSAPQPTHIKTSLFLVRCRR
jgi:hypothetical protein